MAILKERKEKPQGFIEYKNNKKLAVFKRAKKRNIKNKWLPLSE